MRAEYDLDYSEAKRGRYYKRLLTKGSTVVVVTARGKVIARVLLDTDRQVRARKWLQRLRKRASIGDIVSPSGETWNAERGRLLTRTSPPKTPRRRKAR